MNWDFWANFYDEILKAKSLELDLDFVDQTFTDYCKLYKKEFNIGNYPHFDKNIHLNKKFNGFVEIYDEERINVNGEIYHGNYMFISRGKIKYLQGANMSRINFSDSTIKKFANYFHENFVLSKTYSSLVERLLPEESFDDELMQDKFEKIISNQKISEPTLNDITRYGFFKYTNFYADFIQQTNDFLVFELYGPKNYLETVIEGEKFEFLKNNLNIFNSFKKTCDFLKNETCTIHLIKNFEKEKSQTNLKKPLKFGKALKLL